jgi:origin recognition complex subunit 1
VWCRLFLVSVLSEFRKSGLEEAVFADVRHTHVTFCKIRGIEPPTTSTLAGVCARLGGCRLLLVEVGSNPCGETRLTPGLRSTAYFLRVLS